MPGLICQWKFIRFQYFNSRQQKCTVLCHIILTIFRREREREREREKEKVRKKYWIMFQNQIRTVPVLFSDFDCSDRKKSEAKERSWISQQNRSRTQIIAVVATTFLDQSVDRVDQSFKSCKFYIWKFSCHTIPYSSLRQNIIWNLYYKQFSIQENWKFPQIQPKHMFPQSKINAMTKDFLTWKKPVGWRQLISQNIGSLDYL